MALMGAFTAEPLQAQPQPGYYSNPAKLSILSYTTGTNVTASVTNTYSAGTTNRLDVSGGKEVMLSWRFKLNAAGSTALHAVFYPAVEDGKPDTSQAIKEWAVTPNGTTEVVATTNITVNGASYLYLTTVSNLNSADITNSQFYYRVK